MAALVYLGLGFIILSGLINAMQLRRFFKALSVLNSYTKTINDKLLYPYRFLSLLPLLSPLIPDLAMMTLGGAVGLSGGVSGFIISMGGTCAVTLIMKLVMTMSKPKNMSKTLTWKQAHIRALEKT